jgi:hypothetical protein
VLGSFAALRMTLLDIYGFQRVGEAGAIQKGIENGGDIRTDG